MPASHYSMAKHQQVKELQMQETVRLTSAVIIPVNAVTILLNKIHTNDARPLNLDSSTGAGFVARNIFLTCFVRAPLVAGALSSADEALAEGMISCRRNRARSRIS